ncbi:MAG TPA: 4-hydroxy-tetrahydrodipicolinate reductase [Steroidobacteraceae bacterium]|nr:4-hydroxy-tetrahydrodipicolinate reductase [Steroidobacteraceae bacterium]
MSAPGARAGVRLALIGASGRMGRAVLAALAGDAAFTLVAAVAHPGSEFLGADSGTLAQLSPNGIAVTGDVAAALRGAQVAIDFSSAAATAANLAACVHAGTPLVLCATGQRAAEADYAQAGRRIALLVAPNTSLGVTLLLELAQRAARALPQFRLAISETHHVHKRDAPSGTALALAEALAAARGGPATAGSIPIDSRRSGEVVGDHEVVLEASGERLYLGHQALERDIFARGALAAALWLAHQPPGRYAMRDVLGDKTVT